MGMVWDNKNVKTQIFIDKLHFLVGPKPSIWHNLCIVNDCNERILKIILNGNEILHERNLQCEKAAHRKSNLFILGANFESLRKGNSSPRLCTFLIDLEKVSDWRGASIRTIYEIFIKICHPPIQSFPGD